MYLSSSCIGRLVLCRIGRDVDWIALSFVESAKDILNFKKIIKGRASVLTKLEKPIALKNLNEIINVSDAIMIARQLQDARANSSSLLGKKIYSKH